MENLKIKVNTPEESKEAQKYIFSLGYVWHDTKCTREMIYSSPCFYSTFEDGTLARDDSDVNRKHKYVTIQELRDMVVLKRNDVGDANYECHDNKYYLTSCGKNHCWHEVAENGVPVFKWVHCGTPLIEELKPIRKEKTMKEYLDPDNEYALILADDDTKSDQWIKVPPSGVNKYNYLYKSGIDLAWTEKPQFHYGELLWQREKPQEKCADICVDVSGSDAVSHPSHYCSHPSGIECIEITRHHDFAVGNAIKYLWRAGLKDSDNEVQDLKKAVWYIQDKIKQLESKVVDDKTIDWVNEVENARSKD